MLILFRSTFAIAQCTYSGLLTAPNLAVNGNFNSGNSGFTGDYSYSSTNPLPGSSYVITTNAATVHFAFTGTDHTSGTGNFMVINGATSPSNVWKQTISVQTNTYYNFGAWFKNIVTKPAYAGNPIATVELWINNVKISGTLPLVDYPDVWKLLDTSWFSGASTTANLVIKDLGVSGNGNDFAIDDISFKKCCVSQPIYLLQICLGDSIQLNGTPIGTFAWTPVTGMGNPLIGNPKVSPALNTNYVLRSNLGSGTCINYDTFSVSVSTSSINLGPDQLICEGDSFVFNNTAPGSYDWSPIYAISNNKIPNPVVRPTIPTYYYIAVTNGSCVARDTIYIDVVNVSANAGLDKNICGGDSVQLNGSAVGNYFWAPNVFISSPSVLNPYVKPTLSQKYVLTASASSCTITDTVLVSVLSSFAANAGRDTAICKGNSIQLNGVGGISHSWLSNYRLSDSTLSNPIANPLVDTDYVYEAAYGSFCFGYDTVHIDVVDYPEVTAGNDFSYCFNSSAKMIAQVKFFDTLWWTPAAGLSSISEMQPFTFGNNNRQYILFAGQGGCITSDTVKVKVHPPIIAKISAPLFGYAPGELYITNLSTNAVYFQWDFGDGTHSVKPGDQSHFYKNVGLYKVILIVNDSIGCFDSTSLEVNMVTTSYLYIPNAITPNSDGLNDEFAIVSNLDAYAFLTYRIYDRWGELIYETKMPGGKWWDGTFNGKPCVAGIYFYSLEAEDFSKKSYSRIGTIQLLR